MPKYSEIQRTQNYTEADFGSQPVFLTPRAAETALSAGITQIRPVSPELEVIRDYINRENHPRYRYPENIDEVHFVMRWSGAGNKYPWQWDTKLYRTDENTCYVNGWNITQAHIDAARQGDMPPQGIAKKDLDIHRTIELDVNDWQDVNLARQVASGVAFNYFATHTPGLKLKYMALDTTYALIDLLSESRVDVVNAAANAAAQHDRGFDQIMPLAPLQNL